MRYYTSTLLLLFLSFLPIEAKESSINTEDIHISLLTCAPGEPIYTLFGHTAIRIKAHNQNIDRVYNYGLFNFNAPNFIFRFTLGETDYRLGATTYLNFIAEYEYYNRKVWEQTLNLTPIEKKELIHLLDENYKPENRTYRYNFLYDNCSTKPRDIISQSIKGTIQYEGSIDESFRSVVHKFTEGQPWSKFGIDLCLGAPADKKITIEESMFAPIYLMDFYNNAVIIDSEGNQRPLIEETKIVFQPKEKTLTHPSFFSPMLTFSLLFIFIAALSYLGIKRKKNFYAVDFILTLIYTIIGLVLGFLSFFSVHPTVYPNYILLLFNPIHFIALFFLIKYRKRTATPTFLITYCVLLTFFIVVSSLLLQRFNLAIVPLTLCLIVRGINHLILHYQTKE